MSNDNLLGWPGQTSRDDFAPMSPCPGLMPPRQVRQLCEAEPSPRATTHTIEERISDFRAAAQKKQAFLVFDFDRTITAGVDANGKLGGVSCHNILETSGLFSKRYFEECTALHQKYYAIETDTTLTKAEKLPHMQDWYRQSHGALERERLHPEQIVEAVSKARSRLVIREGFDEVVGLAKKAGVPVMVMSAGIAQVLSEVLRQTLGEELASWCHVVSNKMTFDETGLHSGFDGELLHMFNKSLGKVGEDVRRELEACTHCVVVGDSVGDLTMADGVGHLCDKIKVGITNDPEAWPPARLKAEGFDVVCVGALASMEPVVAMLRDL